jgi:hypothetical protein
MEGVTGSIPVAPTIHRVDFLQNFPAHRKRSAAAQSTIPKITVAMRILL